MTDREEQSSIEMEPEAENKLGRVITTICIGGGIFLGVQLLGIIGAVLGVIVGITVGVLLSNLVSPRA
jgi:hypothetical protein